MIRTITVKTKDEMENRMNDLIIQNYRVNRMEENYISLGKNTFGKWYWHLLFFLISLGVLNIIYMIFSYVVSYDKIIIKLEEKPLAKEPIKKTVEEEPINKPAEKELEIQVEEETIEKTAEE